MRRVEKIRTVACPTCDAKAGENCNERGRLRDSNHRARARKYAQAQQFAELGSVQANGGAARDAHGRVLVIDRSETSLPFGGYCQSPSCGERLISIESSVKTRHGWIHRACAPGARDGELIA